MNSDLTRRGLLAGAVALPWLAACSAPAVKPSAVRPSTRPSAGRSSAVRPSAGGPEVVKRTGPLELEDGRFSSRFWPGQKVHWRLARPGHPRAGSEPQRLVVALHGAGSDADWPFEKLNIGSHVVPTGLAVATVDGGHLYWHARSSGIDTGRMVVEELLPLLAGKGLATDRIALMGWSMGGYGALLLASRLGPRRVAGVVATSAALWESPGTWDDSFDDPQDFARNDVFAARDKLRAIPLRLDCGRDDPFIAANRAFALGLSDAAEVTFDEGGHTEQYWTAHAGAQMSWLRQCF